MLSYESQIIVNISQKYLELLKAVFLALLIGQMTCDNKFRQRKFYITCKPPSLKRVKPLNFLT